MFDLLDKASRWSDRLAYGRTPYMYELRVRKSFPVSSPTYGVIDSSNKAGPDANLESYFMHEIRPYDWSDLHGLVFRARVLRRQTSSSVLDRLGSGRSTTCAWTNIKETSLYLSSCLLKTSPSIRTPRSKLVQVILLLFLQLPC